MSSVVKSAVVALAVAAVSGTAAWGVEIFQQGPLRQICDKAGDCIVKFDAVPKKGQLVVTKVSCWYGMLTSNETKVVAVALGSVDKKGVYRDGTYLGAPEMVSIGASSASFALLADVQWAIEPTSSPAVRFSIESAGPNIAFNSLCSISGGKP